MDSELRCYICQTPGYAYITCPNCRRDKLLAEQNELMRQQKDRLQRDMIESFAPSNWQRSSLPEPSLKQQIVDAFGMFMAMLTGVGMIVGTVFITWLIKRLFDL